MGAAGLGALFGGGIVILVVPGWMVPLTVVMLAGVVLLVLAFLLAGGSTFARALQTNDRSIGRR